MDSSLLSRTDISANLKKLRKSKKISQKQLAQMINKSERTIQNYEAGKTEFTMAILKEIAIALDINFRELLSTPDREDGIGIGIDQRDSYANKYKLDTFADIVNVLFKIQETYDISMSIDVKKPPEDKEWKTTISVDGKGKSKFDTDFCLFLENWKQKLDMLYNDQMTIDKYQIWQAETIAYYSESKLTPFFERTDMQFIKEEDSISKYQWVNQKKQS